MRKDTLAILLVTTLALPTSTPPAAPTTPPDRSENPIEVSVKKVKLTEGAGVTLKRKKVLTVRKAAGTVTYKKLDGNKKIRIDRKSGSMTIARRLSPGTHKVRVAVTASGDETHLPKSVEVTLRVKVVALRLTADEQKNYNKITNWGLVFHSAHGIPSGSVPFYGFSLKRFNAVYHGNAKKKRIYLTFDCGYENGNTTRILNTLKKKKVKALFFITKEFLEERPDLVKRMKKEGHLVGNHTMNHPYMSKCSVTRLKSEILGLEKLMKKKTGYKPDPFLRPPYGNYSIKSLNVTRKLGYKTVLWSLAWNDYDTANQPSVSSVVNRFVTHHHKGMLPLMHNTSTADTDALPAIIDCMKKLKYKFRTLS